MAKVQVGLRLLYDGPSKEDARMIYDLCREHLTDYSRIYYSEKPSSSFPRGIIGKVIARLEQGEKVRRDAAKKALQEFKKVMPKQIVSQRGTWNSNPSPVPPKVVIKNLLANSVADSFEDAQKEWEYDAQIIGEGESGFSPECGLCGPKERMKTNYIIKNMRNGNTLKVGSVCVKRFLILSGTSSINESADLFDRRTLLAYYGKKQGYLIADLAKDKIPEKSILAIMETLEYTFPYGISWEDVEIVIREANANEKAGKIFRAIALKDRGVLRSLNRHMDKMSNRREGWQKKVAARVVTTLSKSSAYKISD